MSRARRARQRVNRARGRAAAETLGELAERGHIRWLYESRDGPVTVRLPAMPVIRRRWRDNARIIWRALRERP